VKAAGLNSVGLRYTVPLALVLLAGCAWSNSLYQARLLSGNATTAEREHRTGEAQALWGQVIVKADSAYARDPGGRRGAEALWLSGHAASRTRDCSRAIPKLQGAMTAVSNAPWREEMLFELAECEEASGGPTAASLYATLAASSHDPATLRRARIREGHALVARGDWQAALDVLAGEDTLPARLDRAMADAQLDNGGQALVELRVPLLAADTSVHWLDYIEALSLHHAATADSLLDRVLAFPSVSPQRRAAWLLASARDALDRDPAAADRRLRRLAAMPASLPVTQGRLLQEQLRVRRATTPDQLRGATDSLSRVPATEDVAGDRIIAGVVRMSRQLLDRNQQTAAGSDGGDLAVFGIAEAARDSLHAPQLGAWFFGRIERDWPHSPYVAKAIMARGALEPDSAVALLARVQALTDNPYVAAANGEIAGRLRVTRLEDSLGRYIGRMWSTRANR
jgi:hypothetical protein